MKALLLKVWDWMRDKAWPVVKAAWKPLLIVGAAIVTAFVVKRIIQSILGKVDKPSNWSPVANDPTSVVVSNPGQPAVIVKLPVDPQGKQITSDQVSGVAYEPGYQATVEVVTDAHNRR